MQQLTTILNLNLNYMGKFEVILGYALSFLGITAFSKNTEGKSVLTDEQKQKLTEKWGEKFIAEFKKELAEYEKDGKKADSPATQVAIKQLEEDKEKFVLELKTAQDQVAALKKREGELNALVAKLEGEEAPDGGKKVEGEDGMGKGFKPDMKLRYNKYIEAIAMSKPSASFDGETIDTLELQAEFGKYVTQTTEIFRSLLGTTDSLKYMTTMITDKFEIKASHAHITSVLQSFTPQWIAKGGAHARLLSR
jgi:predicted nuclease with TOPRIM domain